MTASSAQNAGRATLSTPDAPVCRTRQSAAVYERYMTIYAELLERHIELAAGYRGFLEAAPTRVGALLASIRDALGPGCDPAVVRVSKSSSAPAGGRWKPFGPAWVRDHAYSLEFDIALGTDALFHYRAVVERRRERWTAAIEGYWSSMVPVDLDDVAGAGAVAARFIDTDMRETMDVRHQDVVRAATTPKRFVARPVDASVNGAPDPTIVFY